MTTEPRAAEAPAPYYLLFLLCLLKIFFISLVLLLSVLLCAEGLFRYMGLSPARTVMQGALESGISLNTYTGWRNAQNLKHPSQAQRSTNNFGLRGHIDNKVRKAEGKFRVGVFGSSVTFGTNVPYEGTIPVNLESQLKTRGIDAEVLNFGVPGYSLLNVDAYIKTYTWDLSLDAIVVVLDAQMLLGNESVIDDFSNTRAQPFEKMFWFKRVLKQGALASAAINWLDIQQEALAAWLAKHETQGLAPAPANKTVAPQVTKKSPAAIAAYEKARRATVASFSAGIASFCRERGIQTYFVTSHGSYYGMSDQEIKERYPNFLDTLYVTHIVDGYNLSPAQAFKHDTEMIADVLQDVALRYQAHVVNLMELLGPRPLAYYLDPIHYNEVGGKKLGEGIAQKIFANQQRFTRK